jgi:signal peptidase I
MGSPGDRIEVVGGHVVIDGTLYDHEQVRDALARAGVFGADWTTAPSADQSYCHAKFVQGGVMANGNLVSEDRLGAIIRGEADAHVTVEPGFVIRNGRRLTENYTAEDPDYDMKIENGEPVKHDFGKTGSGQEYTLGTYYISAADYESYASRPTEPIPPGDYLMMGDNRNDSYDGTCWGLLDGSRIVGGAAFIFWPPSRMGSVH